MQNFVDHNHDRLEEIFRNSIQEYLLSLDPKFNVGNILSQFQASRHNEIVVEGITNSGKTTLINYILCNSSFLNTSSVRETTNFYRIKKSKTNDMFFSQIGLGGQKERTLMKTYNLLRLRIQSLSINQKSDLGTQANNKKEEARVGQPQDTTMLQFEIELPNLPAHLKAEINYDIVDVPGIEDTFYYTIMREYINANQESIVPILVIPLSQGTVKQKHFDDIINMCKKSLGGTIILFTKVLSYQGEVKNELQAKLPQKQLNQSTSFFGQNQSTEVVSQEQVLAKMSEYIQIQIKKIREKLDNCSFFLFEFDKDYELYADEQCQISTIKGKLNNSYLISNPRDLLLTKINQNMKKQEKERMISLAQVFMILASDSLIKKTKEIQESDMFKIEKLSFIKEEIERGNQVIQDSFEQNSIETRQRKQEEEKINKKQQDMGEEAKNRLKETLEEVQSNLREHLMMKCNEFNEKYGYCLDKKKFNNLLASHVREVLCEYLLLNFTKKAETILQDLSTKIYDTQTDQQRTFKESQGIFMPDYEFHAGGILFGGISFTGLGVAVLERVIITEASKALLVGFFCAGTVLTMLAGFATVGYLAYTTVWSKEEETEELLNKVCNESMPEYLMLSEQSFNTSVDAVIKQAKYINRRIFHLTSDEDNEIVSRVMRNQGIEYEVVCNKLKKIKRQLADCMKDVQSFA